MGTLLDQVVSRALGSEPATARGVRLTQRGELRLAPDKPWLPFRAEQVIDATQPAFRWTAGVRMGPLARVRIVDAYEDGHGRLGVKLWRILPLARAAGPELDAGELLRYLAELPWCPFAYRANPHLTVIDVSATELAVAARTGDRSCDLRLTVEKSGDVTSVLAAERPRLVGKRYLTSPWSAVFLDHDSLGGIRVPRRGVVTWQLPEGPFECWRGEVTSLEPLPATANHP